MQESNRRQTAAEVRLLLATITISAIALLLLARLRFPEPAPAPQLAVTRPLERLAATATYDELARIVGTVQTRIAPSLLPLRFTGRQVTDLPLDASELAMATVASPITTAIRIDDTTALTYVPPSASVSERLLSGEAATELVAVDEIRGLALLKVPHGPAIVPRSSLDRMVEVPAYMAVGEPTAAGAALRPVFIARADAFEDSRWGTTLYSLGMEAAAPGTPLFLLSGEFMGLLVPAAGDGIALLPAQDVMAAASRLQRGGSIRRGRPGFSVQPLTPPLASATGASGGVVVAHVDSNGPAGQTLRVGDVIEAVGENAAADLDAFLTLVSRVEPGATLTLTVLRGGARSQVTVTSGPPEAAQDDRTLGMTLRTLRATGAEVVLVAPGTAAARAGIRAGDIVTHLDGAEQPTADSIERAWAAARGPLVLGIRRGIQPLVLAVPSPLTPR